MSSNRHPHSIDFSYCFLVSLVLGQVKGTSLTSILILCLNMDQFVSRCTLRLEDIDQMYATIHSQFEVMLRIMRGHPSSPLVSADIERILKTLDPTLVDIENELTRLYSVLVGPESSPPPVDIENLNMG